VERLRRFPVLGLFWIPNRCWRISQRTAVLYHERDFRGRPNPQSAFRPAAILTSRKSSHL